MREDTINKLKPYQVAPTEHLVSLLRSGVNALDGSKCGAGKTYVAAAVVKEMSVPTLVVVPKVAESEWRRAGEHMGVKFSLCSYDLARTGTAPYGYWDNPLPKGEKNDHGDSVRSYYVCQSCQRNLDLGELDECYCHPQGIHCVVKKTKRWSYGRFHWHDGIKLLVFDEAHRCGAVRSLNAEMMIAAKRQGIQSLSLTATPACTPLNMRALGYTLDLHRDANFYPWARKHGCGTLPNLRGFHWTVGRDRQKKVMRDIRREIFPARGVALDYSDIPGFPDRVIKATLYDLKDKERLDSLYQQVRDQVDDIDRRSLGYVSNALTERLVLRQRIEMLKVPIMIERAEDLVRQGMSVALFVNFSATLRELRDRLSVNCYIDGSQTGPKGAEKRARCVADFQADEEPIIVVNNAAGGLSVSLHDLHGDRAREGLISVPESAVQLLQLLGRLHRTGGKSPAFYDLILAAGTVETRIHSRVNANINNIEALTDDDLDATRE